LYFWLLKNVIVSGCFIFPLKISCLEKLEWTNSQQIIESQIEGEAWSKAWPDRLNKSISQSDYIKNFNWIKTWSNIHLIKILEILFPYLFLIFLTTIFLIKKNMKKYKNNNLHSKNVNNSFNFAFLISTIGVISFFQFPLYRFSFSYIVSLISLFFIFFLKKKNFSYYNINIFKIFFILCFVIILSKQFYRILKINSFENPWPKIHNFSSEVSLAKEKKFISKNFYYYFSNKGDTLCMYGYSPCSNYLILKNIEYKKIYSYSFLVLLK
jgi:hypothetical protein